jgi:hypothetical protein
MGARSDKGTKGPRGRPPRGRPLPAVEARQRPQLASQDSVRVGVEVMAVLWDE